MQQVWSPNHAYVNKLDSVVELLSTNVDHGLTKKEVTERLASEGGNAIERVSDVRPQAILFAQFKSSVVILLLVAAAISTALGEWLQTIGIIAAVFINALVGFMTEYRASLSLEKLSKLSGAVARVRRGGSDVLVPVDELVRGDLLLLEAGDRVPADCRLVEAPSLSVDESILTGESLPVWKDRSAHSDWESAVLFQGTSVSSGRAKAMVISTGTDTRLGALAVTTTQIDNAPTPLQLALDKLGQQLTWMTCVICLAVAAVGTMRGIEPLHMLETSVALAVAAIPEGLPVVATLALAIGIRRMVRRRALVRRLTAVETLGCTTTICTDKTGTLTENKMSVNRALTTSGTTVFQGTAYDTTGSTISIESTDPAIAQQELQRLLTAAALCNDAALQEKNGIAQCVGDPTEAALLVAARKSKLNEHELNSQFKRVVELPFDLQRKRMSTVHAAQPASTIVFCKGGPETVLPLCTRVAIGDKSAPLTSDERNRMMERNIELAKSGLRVLAVAEKTIPQETVCIDPANLESDLTLLGFVGMSDAIRSGISNAIETCKAAGINVIMLTGDQQNTAQAVAKSIGIPNVLARVTPEMKLDVVRKLQTEGNIVAMTGDGVNDAPALKQSDIGIAMGGAGSDLARDASDLVITDDNFATIVAAIEEGRAIYRNIKLAVTYLLTASVTSVLVVSFGVIVDRSLLLSPLQLLWLNLIMHVFPGIGLVLQRDGEDTMHMPPRAPREPLLTTDAITSIMLAGIIIACAIAFFTSPRTALVVLCFSLLLQSWSGVKRLCNGPMLASTAAGALLLLAAIYVPGLRAALQTEPLSGYEWTFSLAIAVGTYVTSLLARSIARQIRQRLSSQSGTPI